MDDQSEPSLENPALAAKRFLFAESIDPIEHGAFFEEPVLGLAPALAIFWIPETSLMSGKIGVLRQDRFGRTIVIRGQDFLASGGIKNSRYALATARSPCVLTLASTGHSARRLSPEVWRINDFQRLARLPSPQVGLVLPGQMHVADFLLGESRRG